MDGGKCHHMVEFVGLELKDRQDVREIDVELKDLPGRSFVCGRSSSTREEASNSLKPSSSDKRAVASCLVLPTTIFLSSSSFSMIEGTRVCRMWSFWSC